MLTNIDGLCYIINVPNNLSKRGKENEFKTDS
jgi:hypothetical protein